MPSKQTILIVEDDARLRKTIREVLTQYDFKVEEAANGDEMSQLMEAKSIDLLLLDLGLGGEDGLELARGIRKRSDIPLIMLTGRSGVIDRVVGLEVGADDYITKPFHNRELIARITGVLRRSQSRVAEVDTQILTDNHVVLVNGWELDLSSQALTAPDGEIIVLTAYEFQLLAILCQNPSKTLSRNRILNLLNGRDWHPNDRSIDVIIGKLRKKFRDDPVTSKFIKTIRNLGYMFIADVEFMPHSRSISLKRFDS